MEAHAPARRPQDVVDAELRRCRTGGRGRTERLRTTYYYDVHSPAAAAWGGVRAAPAAARAGVSKDNRSSDSSAGRAGEAAAAVMSNGQNKVSHVTAAAAPIGRRRRRD